MICLTRLDGSQVTVNAELILTIEKTPDTVVTLTNGARIMVTEPVDQVVEKVVAYRHAVGRDVKIIDHAGER
jgi:flagellar protein FlbD